MLTGAPPRYRHVDLVLELEAVKEGQIRIALPVADGTRQSRWWLPRAGGSVSRDGSAGLCWSARQATALSQDPFANRSPHSCRNGDMRELCLVGAGIPAVPLLETPRRIHISNAKSRAVHEATLAIAREHHSAYSRTPEDPWLCTVRLRPVLQPYSLLRSLAVRKAVTARGQERCSCRVGATAAIDTS